MTRIEAPEYVDLVTSDAALRKRNISHQESPPPTQKPYGLRMRNSAERDRDAWAAYAKQARTDAGINMSELARRLGIDRTTIYRWETGAQRPDDPELVARFVDILGIDLNAALTAAGLRLTASTSAEGLLTTDEEINLVKADRRLSPAMRVRIIGLIHERRERERAAGLAETKGILDALGEVG